MKYFMYCRKSSEDDERQALSIESQRRECDRLRAALPAGAQVEVIEESRSAKHPGRAHFGRMMKAIERREAGGIIAWDPDRLARNSMDGGWVLHLLDQGLLKELKFCTFNFENSPQGKFMLGIMFTNAKYYVDALSANVRRGNRTKVENGWLPCSAAPGYLNEPVTRTIVADAERFSLVQRMFRLVLTAEHSPAKVVEVANSEWGYRTRLRKRIGGKPLTLSMFYRMLANPFYAGIIVWEGKSYLGKHPPMITLEEFDRIQELLGRPGRPRPKEHSFTYTGLIRCGACGLAVTAETKTNRYGSRYTYYHCTRRKSGQVCREPSIEEGELEEQVVEWLEEVELPEAVAIHVRRLLGARLRDAEAVRADQARMREQTGRQVERELENLTTLRLKDLIGDEEFARRREALDRERLRLGQKPDTDREPGRPIELLESLLSFSAGLKNRFLIGNGATKRAILQTVGSNLRLSAQNLSIDVHKPFRKWSTQPDLPTMCTFMEDVRTFVHSPESLRLRNLWKSLQDTPEAA